MKNLIITGGNYKYFDYLNLFVKSLRKFDNDTKVIICDNTISGTWDKPGKIVSKPSFKEEQMLFFKKNNIDIITLSDLLKEFKISKKILNNTHTSHWAYPAKYWYCYLLSCKYKDEVDNIIFSDADVFFQNDPKILFSEIKEDTIYLNHEKTKIKESSFLMDWINFTNDNSISKELPLIQINDSMNYCTGFFGAKSDVFYKMMHLCVNLSTSKTISFHNDQPLMNILVSHNGLTTNSFSDKLIHLAHTNNLTFIEETKSFLVGDDSPIILHYHGKHRDLIKEKLWDDYKPVEPSLYQKVLHKLKNM